MSDRPFFEFEMDFVEGLRCIPMVVRYRLDTIGIKLKLVHWNQLTESERLQLVDWPCETAVEQTAYRDRLRQLVAGRLGDVPKDLLIEASPLWESSAVPEGVATKVAEEGMTLSSEAWRSLTVLQRFALIKLSRAGHENRNFPIALREFGLLGQTGAQSPTTTTPN
ncbi:MAG: nitrate reductase associated protein [Oscillatoriales cyanobacterium]|nr:MAG: nitrate reductase associated protein [Oscillatoriales cyanobacterium]